MNNLSSVLKKYLSKFKKQSCPYCGTHSISFFQKGYLLNVWKEIRCPDCHKALMLDKKSNVLRWILLAVTVVLFVTAWVNARVDCVVGLFWLWFVLVILANELIIIPFAKIEKMDD